MRTAGCIINDVVDKKYDSKVERTKDRPIATGEITVFNALSLAFFMFISFYSFNSV